jgi:predicted 2-oxoglutarate/Fe(II)-dependent dioxygenase YbiX
MEVTELPEKYKKTIYQRLLSLMPEISVHYEINLSNFQPPKYSIYQTGDFYKVHVDADVREDSIDFLKARKVSVIVFLNEESPIEKEGSYCGGNLTFHGLIENEVFGKFGFPLQSEPGMLITFLPDLLHEVTPVTAGKRFAITTWYI